MTTAMALPFTSMGDIATAGQLLAQANFLGTRNPGEGFMVMAACSQMGMSLVDFQQKFHLRQGRFSIQAHELLAQLVARGGSYKIIERSPARAALEMAKDANVYLSEITWDQAMQEPFVYGGREEDQLAELGKPVEKRRLKAKYQTPRSRMQMLWARAVSDGVVCVDPGARGGMYTPEETDDIIDVANAAVTAGPTPVAIPVEAITQRVEAVAAAAVSFAPPAPAKPAVVVPAVDPEPNPFLMAAAKSINFAVCPIPECAVTGKPWSEFDAEDLKVAVEFQHPAMLAEHYNAIRDALAAKGVK